MRKIYSNTDRYLKGLFTFENSPEGSKKKKETLILMGTAGCMLAAGIIVGINDNVTGIVLCFLATIALVLLPVHAWRKAKRFLVLTAAAIVGFFIFVLLHNAFYALAIATSNFAALKYPAEALSIVCFIIAIFICPSAFVVGAAGSLVRAISNSRKYQKA